MTPVDYSSPGSSVLGIAQARIPEWVAISFPRGLPNPEIEPVAPPLTGGFFTTEPPGELCLQVTVIAHTQISWAAGIGHLMQRANSLEKTLMLEKIEGKRRRE